MALRLRGGPAVECLTPSGLQQGAGERIPAAVLKLGQTVDLVKAF